jgi:purine-binding chemotaxis protein CheW
VTALKSAIAVTDAADDAQLIVVRLADGKFAFRLEDVREIVRMPRLARMPLAPSSLLGLANLHGQVLPVVELRSLLGLATERPDDAMVVVVGREAPVGFTVDRIERLVTLPAQQIEAGAAGAGSINPELLSGVVKGIEGESTIKILNPQRLLRDELSHLGLRAENRAPKVQGSVVNAASGAGAAAAQTISLVSFDLGGQEYALPLDRVREIIQLPKQVAEMARSEAAVLGVVTLRDSLLPLVSLRALLGLPPIAAAEAGKVVVLPLGRGAVGVVADRTREILHVDQDAIDPAPALLTRGEGDAEIASICRLDRGRRLVAVLSPDRLFRSDLIRRLLSEQASEDSETIQEDGSQMADEQFIVFRLGNQEYGLPIAAVDEIARRPDQVARMPKAPAFVDGVMNLRGAVMPIIDLRRRFDIVSDVPSASRRILVLSVGGGKTGFVVDGVSEIMRIPEDAIRPAPEITSEQMRLIGRVANLEAQDRMILLIDPEQLLDRIETDLLAEFGRTASGQKSKAS